MDKKKEECPSFSALWFILRWQLNNRISNTENNTILKCAGSDRSCLRRDYCSPTHRHYRVADDRTTGHHRDPSVSPVCGADMPRVYVLADDVPRLQHVPDLDVYLVRVQDAQNPGGLQRGQVHRLHHVFDVHRLAGLRAHLLRHQQRLQGLYWRKTDHVYPRTSEPYDAFFWIC